MVLLLFIVVLLLLVVVLVALDFLLSFYKHFLLVQYSGLSNILTASTTPIPNQKLIISSAVKAAARPSYLLEVNEFLFVSFTGSFSPYFPLVLPFLLLSDK